ncbi:hypothetical protein K432DRAFT_398562 [Lepidopterella palustris CBS 459.81]|uniref:Uncharacterized protein n=1 Tax=Lepidopterella palustris CBS 459.81 TaxID=1314670 RepID=A0A8E2DY59_9PEZI|nr:hypothetical protein K432DRAFT_398562 [Lepidopterella palustris CBS 459.81]
MWTIAENPIKSLFYKVDRDFEKDLLSYLNIYDILSLLCATGAILSKSQHTKYMQVIRYIFPDDQWCERMQAIGCTPILTGKDLQLIQRAVTDPSFYRYLVGKRLTILCVIASEPIIVPPPKCMHVSPFYFRKSEINPFVCVPMSEGQRFFCSRRKSCANCQEHVQTSTDIQEQNSRVRVLVKTAFCLGWNTVTPAQIIENRVRMTIAMEQNDRIRLIGESARMLPYIAVMRSNEMVATATRRQALTAQTRSSRGKAIFEIPFHSEPSKDAKTVARDRWLWLVF